MREPFEIIFEDEYLIVLNKIAKLLIQPSPHNERYTLTSLLAARLNSAVFPCHRLDRETTGLILYAKKEAMQRRIMEEFKKREVKKKYIAYVAGHLVNKKGVLEGYIIDREGARFGEKPKKAKTRYRVLHEFRDFSSLELEPLTGRTNQLRIQLAKIGHPILGERKYALRRDFKVKFRRLALHAFFLSFVHPVRKERISLTAELPHDMKDFLAAHNQKVASG
jgi:RluA family pseudouridine synthase